VRDPAWNSGLRPRKSQSNAPQDDCGDERGFLKQRPTARSSHYNHLVPDHPPDTPQARLERVFAQLRLYEHPLLDFSARVKGEGVEVIIEFKNPPVPVHTYYFDLHPRDLDHAQFEWTFQRQLFDCLHDYIIEMFTRTPQNRVERQREGL
jgi:hypothetical protein